MTHGQNCLIRGGSWNYFKTYSRARDRNWFVQGQRFDFLGVRLIRVRHALQQIAESTAPFRNSTDTEE